MSAAYRCCKECHELHRPRGLSGMVVPGSLKTAASGTVTPKTAERIVIGDDGLMATALTMPPAQKLVCEAVGQQFRVPQAATRRPAWERSHGRAGNPAGGPVLAEKAYRDRHSGRCRSPFSG